MLTQVYGVYSERKSSCNQTQHQLILMILGTKHKVNENKKRNQQQKTSHPSCI